MGLQLMKIHVWWLVDYKSPVKISDEHELAKHVWRIFSHYQSSGFPHFIFSEAERLVEFSSFQRLDRDRLFDGVNIKQAQHGLGLAWSYFPHHWGVKCNRNMSVEEAWGDERKLRQAIEKSLKGGRYEVVDGLPFLGLAKMRAAIAYVSGVQRVSNFRPSAAALIYDLYGGETVWDMSSGYGGRLLGAIASPSVRHYIGTDPHFETYVGLQRMKDDFAHLTKTNVTLDNVGSENYVLHEESVDLCFTSPPYFDTEKYALDQSQSFIKFPSVGLWNEHFLAGTVSNAYTALKPGGRMILNVANTKTHESLEADTVRYAENVGFILDKTLRLVLSSMGGGVKSEPVFVFKK